MSKIICCDYPNQEGEGVRKFQNWLIGIDGCCQITNTCWIVAAVETNQQIVDRLRGYLGADARIFVASLEKGSGVWVNALESSEVLQDILKS